MRWMKRFDGSKDSLKDLSKRPHTPHPNAHTSDEIKHIEDLLRRKFISTIRIQTSLA